MFAHEADGGELDCRPGMGVHPTATAFGLVAEEYERGRPGYPQEAVDWLVEHAGLDGSSVVVDVAAGTGKLTRMLVPMVGRVVAVEPSDGMRSALAAAVPGAEAIDGTADRLPLADGAAQAITVAQAFHWFAGDEALAEFQRVVGPGGRLAIVYNRRDQEQPLQRRLEEIVSRHRGDRVPSVKSGRWREVIDATTRFTAEGEASFPNPVEMTAATLVDRVASTSIIASLPDDERAEALAEVRALGDAEPERFPLEHVTEVRHYRAR
jgi:ubiquinone/menaquinone biosynthesis C-methylase UbiE